MSGLSARTSSCGGEAGRFLWAGGLDGACVVVVAIFFFFFDEGLARNLSRGPMTFASSSLAGGDDKTEESSESLMLWGREVAVEVG